MTIGVRCAIHSVVFGAGNCSHMHCALCTQPKLARFAVMHIQVTLGIANCEAKTMQFLFSRSKWSSVMLSFVFGCPLPPLLQFAQEKERNIYLVIAAFGGVQHCALRMHTTQHIRTQHINETFAIISNFLFQRADACPIWLSFWSSTISVHKYRKMKNDGFIKKLLIHDDDVWNCVVCLFAMVPI